MLRSTSACHAGFQLRRLRELQELLGRMQQQQAAAAAGGLPPGTAPAFTATEAEDLEHQVSEDACIAQLGHGVAATECLQPFACVQLLSHASTLPITTRPQVAEARQALDRLQAIIDGPPAEYPTLVEGEHAQVGS